METTPIDPRLARVIAQLQAQLADLRHEVKILERKVIEPERRRCSLLSWLGLPRRPEAADFAADLAARLEERLIWARFGL